jgi:uncharacterized protein YecE (DUF72 family)
MMEFGRVAASAISKIDFTLPPDPEQNASVLESSHAVSRKLYVGCPKWTSKTWLGKIYPEQTKEKDFLKEYVKHFNSIELNATHYKVYDHTAIRKWAAMAKDQEDFLFLPKMYKEITHSGSMYEKELLTYAFLDPLKEFGAHLGPVFIQLSDQFSPERQKELADYLSALPEGFNYFLELRHRDWFAAGQQSFFYFLSTLNIGIVIIDTPGGRDCAHMRLTTNKTMVRFVSNSLHPTDYDRIDSWVQRLKAWYDKGLEACYFFTHMPDEEFCPELNTYFAKQMTSATGINIRLPKFIEKNTMF